MSRLEDTVATANRSLMDRLEAGLDLFDRAQSIQALWDAAEDACLLLREYRTECQVQHLVADCSHCGHHSLCYVLKSLSRQESAVEDLRDFCGTTPIADV